ncbi:TPA: PilC family type IV pilus tip adhesin [Neisseria weaveri]
MKKNDIHRSKLSPFACTIASALALVSLEAHAKFAEIPLHLQNENTVTEQKVKPQVMFLIDDSGSMEWEVGSRNKPKDPNNSRMAIAKRALHRVLDKYQDNFKWGLHTLNDASLNTNGYITYAQMKNKVGELKTKGPTPTTLAYYNTAKTVMDNTLYRCQKNYIVVMSDGDANESYKMPQPYDYLYDVKRYYTYYPDSIKPHYEPDYIVNSQFTASLNNSRPPAILGKSPVQKNLLNNYYQQQEGIFSLRSQTPISLRANRSYIPNFINDHYFGYKEGGLPAFIYHKNTPHILESWDEFWDRDEGLKWFSHTLATKDFKTKGDTTSGSSYHEQHWDGHPDDPFDYSKQTAETFTVGFGSSISEVGKQYLSKGASKPSYYFNAESAELLVQAFDTIFSNIADANVPVRTNGTVAPTVFGNGVPNLAAIVSVNSGSWSSQIKFFDINAQGKLTSSQPKEPLFSERKTLINLGRPIGVGTNKQIFWADRIEGGNNGMFNLTSASETEWQDALIPWTTRTQDDNSIAANARTRNFSQPYRIRPTTSPSPVYKDFGNQRNLGDILDTPVLTIGDLVNNRQKYLVTAANDGMVHLFKAHNQTNPYSLKLSYIPAGMDREPNTTMGMVLKDVAHEEYGKKSNPHQYLINGGLVLRRTAPNPGNNQSHSFLFGAMGQGGRGAYALNIGGHDRATNSPTGIDSPTEQWINTVPLFETEKGVNNKLGYTVGTPQIGRIALKRTQSKVNIAEDVVYAGFLASGYSLTKGKQSETALYIYNMLGQNAADGTTKGRKGELIRKIEVTNTVGGLSSPTLVDTDFDGTVDIAYAGDYSGNMYRFDFRDDDSSKWKVSKIYQGNSSQPITAAPAISRRGKNKYVVIFGTGSDLYQDDRDSKVQQAVYGIFDDVSKNAAEVQDGQLLKQQLTVNGDNRQVTNNLLKPNEHKGWMVNLGAGDGERVVIKPTMVLRSAFISTRIYHSQKNLTRSANNDMCLPDVTNHKTNSSSWVLALNALTGGMPSKADAHIKFIERADDPNAIAAGMKYSGIVNFSYVDGNNRGDDAVTADGDSGGTGTDKPLNDGEAGAPKNHCFSAKGKRFILKTDQETVEVDGKVCSGVRRISWREIF